MFAEDVIEEFDSDSVEFLGDRITHIAEANGTQPLLVTTSNADVLPLKHSFLIKRSYVPDDEKRLFELVVYGPKDPVAWKAKLEDSARRTESKPLGMSTQQDFMHKATKRMFEEVEKNLGSPPSAPFQGLGFASMDEFRTFFEDRGGTLQPKKNTMNSILQR